MEKTSFLCPELLKCQVCEEQYEAKVEIENCVRMFMKLKFGKIFLKFKRKSVKYPQRKTVDDKNEEGSSQIMKIVYQILIVKIAKRHLTI